MQKLNIQKIRGLVVPIITPEENGVADAASLTKLLNFLIKNKVDAIFILGTTGEFQHLSLAEKKRIIKISTAIINKRLPLLVGISAQTIEEIQQLIQTANNLNVDAVVLAPLFGRGNPYKKIQIVIKKSRSPLLIYNNPIIHNNKNLDLNFLKQFSDNKKIIGIKDSSGDAHYFKKLLKLKSKKFKIFQGRERSIINSLRKGASGIIAGTANVYPQEFKALILKKDSRTMNKILKYKKELSSSSNYISGIKAKLLEMNIIKTNHLFSQN